MPGAIIEAVFPSEQLFDKVQLVLFSNVDGEKFQNVVLSSTLYTCQGIIGHFIPCLTGLSALL